MSRALTKLSGMIADIKINIKKDSFVSPEMQSPETKKSPRKNSRKSKEQDSSTFSMETMATRVKNTIINLIQKIPSILGVIGGVYSLYQIYVSSLDNGVEKIEMIVTRRSYIQNQI